MKQSIVEKIVELTLQIKQRGFIEFLDLSARVIINCVLYPYYTMSKPSETFVFQKQNYNYFYHWYNFTWANERAVEIPIIMNFVEAYSNKNILEVGNVLSHYFDCNHDILDKHEKSKNVMNQDIVDFQPSDKYDLIVSISTLEHVGFDDKPKNPAKFYYAIQNLIKILKPQGKIIFTVPIGYNPEMVKLKKDGEIEFTNLLYLIKISGNNAWKEASFKEACDIKYNTYMRSANGLVIGLIEKN